MPTQGSVRAVRFGDYELNLESNELRKHDGKVPAPDQALRILSMLLERPGEIVTRKQLMARLGPERPSTLTTESTPRYGGSGLS